MLASDVLAEAALESGYDVNLEKALAKTNIEMIRKQIKELIKSLEK